MGVAVAAGVVVQETEKQVEQHKAQGLESVLLTGVDASLYEMDQKMTGQLSLILIFYKKNIHANTYRTKKNPLDLTKIKL